MIANSEAELFRQFADVLSSPLAQPGFKPEPRTRSRSGYRPQHAMDNHNAHRRAKDPGYIAAEQSKNGHGPSARATAVRVQVKRREVEATGAVFRNVIVLDEKGKEVWV